MDYPTYRWTNIVLLFYTTYINIDLAHHEIGVFRAKVSRSPGVWGIWGEVLFIFRELGSTGNYFQGFVEFGDLNEPCKKVKNKF